jgi:hypothetical protein
LLDDVEKDLREMKVKRWRQNAVEREEWASVIREANALRGPQSKEVSEKVSELRDGNCQIFPSTFQQVLYAIST